MLKPGRNEPCPCGSGKKYKQCCLQDQARVQSSPAAYNLNIRQAMQSAMALHQTGKLVQAETIYRQVLQQSPRHPDALHMLGLIAHRSGNLDKALDLIGRAIGLQGREPGFHNNLGLVYKDLNQFDEAAACYRTALTLKPDFAQAICNLGVVLAAQGQFGEAEAHYRRALEIRPGFVEAVCNLGIALAEQGRFDAAVVQYRHALEIKPDFAEAHYNLGLAYHQQGKLEQARNSCLKAVEYRPAYPEAWYLLGVIYQGQGDTDRALASFEEVIARDPQHIGALCNSGLELVRQNRLDEAETMLGRVLMIEPAHVESRYYLGYTRLMQGRHQDAIADCLKVLALKPDYAAAFDTWLFALLYQNTNTRDEIYRAHCSYAERFEAPVRGAWPAHRNPPDPGRKLRIGYVSPDFHLHSVSYFIEPVFAHHDRSQFEIHCYSNSNLRDDFTDRFIKTADHWIPCFDMTDEKLAERILADGIDILVDLAGHSAHNRLRAFARKPAPVQVTWLGYPATTGLTAMDYRITAAVVDPEESERWHSEKLWRLPHTLWCYRPAAQMTASTNPGPAQVQDLVTFGSMNNLSKLTPETLVLWAEILRAVPDAHLLMTNILGNSALQRIREFLMSLGIEKDRLSLHGRLPFAEFYALSNEIDIALDPFPYNGTTTTCESLWMGIPVVTLIGNSSVSRSGYALMKAVGLEELCARDEADYVSIAVELARNTARLNELRSSMRQRMEASPLRDEQGFTRDVETAYRAMWRAWCASGAEG